MKEYVSPVVEFIELEDNDIITESCPQNYVCPSDAECPQFVCPSMYGNACGGNPINQKLQDSVSKSKGKKQEDIVKVGFDLTFDK